MSKVSWETVLSKCKELDLKPESVLKIVQRMSGKGRKETPKEVLRASWVNDVAYHIYHRIGTDHDKKVPNKTIIRNYVKTPHYRECYKLFNQKEWDELPTIKKSKFSKPIEKERALIERHTSNCEKLLLSPTGKQTLSFLIMSGGNMLKVPGTKEQYLKNLKEGLKKIKRPRPTKEKEKTFLETVGFKIVGKKIVKI
jgi:hypothetical protein